MKYLGACIVKNKNNLLMEQHRISKSIKVIIIVLAAIHNGISH